MGKHGKHRPLVRIAALVYLIFTSALQADCRQALAIGLDVSGSVDGAEYRLQLDGLAGALQDTEVRAALMALPSAPVALAVYEWSGPEDQHLIVDWTLLRSLKALDHVTTRLKTTNRTKVTPSTAIGSSMLYGAALLVQQSECWTRTLDLSGDGLSNSGPRPRDVKQHRLLAQITINALVIGSGNGTTKAADLEQLTDYFESEVINGPAAFAEQAAGFNTFQTAMVRKLLRELQGLTISQLRPAD